MLNYNIIKGGKDYLLLLHGFMEDSSGFIGARRIRK